MLDSPAVGVLDLPELARHAACNHQYQTSEKLTKAHSSPLNQETEEPSRALVKLRICEQPTKRDQQPLLNFVNMQNALCDDDWQMTQESKTAGFI